VLFVGLQEESRLGTSNIILSSLGLRWLGFLE